MTFLDLPKPAIIAHRGASSYAPENTLAAFKLAMQQSADAIELDAMLCGSGEIVVIHDASVDRTTQGIGRVDKMPLAALKALDAGTRFDEKFMGEKIPTLEEVFETIGSKVKINIELKNFTSPFDDLPQKAAALVKRHNLIGQVFFSSFIPWNLTRAHREIPQVPICLLTQRGQAGGWLAGTISRLIHCSAIHPDYTDVTQQFVERAHQRGQYVNTWKVNNAEDMQRLMGFGVDGIISDDPILALQVRSSLHITSTSTG